jgi:hypothetical protein
MLSCSQAHASMHVRPHLRPHLHSRRCLESEAEAQAVMEAGNQYGPLERVEVALTHDGQCECCLPAWAKGKDV